MTERKVRAVAVDAVVVKGNNLLVVKRKFEPFKDCLVLPGGFIDPDETVEDAVVREVFEETGYSVTVDKLIGIYSNPARDSRQNISIAFSCRVLDGELKDSEETEATWIPLFPNTILGFDHNQILNDAIKGF